ncbi:hypothetical protein [Mycobacterium sp.]|uniref:hypothetical protein n=1 Tax=Mycobacterium sp. TaxID=1785 RepID=UPI003C74BD62
MYWTTQGTGGFDIFDPPTGHVIATYDATVHVDAALLAALTNTVTQVIDTTAGGPAVGTVWGVSEFGIPIIAGTDFFVQPVLVNYSESDPTGTTQDWFQIPALQVGDYFSTGPAGTLDELTFQGLGPFSFVVPLFDIPAAASTAAATDTSSLLSDLSAMF